MPEKDERTNVFVAVKRHRYRDYQQRERQRHADVIPPLVVETLFQPGRKSYRKIYRKIRYRPCRKREKSRQRHLYDTQAQTHERKPFARSFFLFKITGYLRRYKYRAEYEEHKERIIGRCAIIFDVVEIEMIPFDEFEYRFHQNFAHRQRYGGDEYRPFYLPAVYERVQEVCYHPPERRHMERAGYTRYDDERYGFAFQYQRNGGKA